MTKPLAIALNDLSEAEKTLIDAAGRGEDIDLHRQEIRGAVFADLLRQARPGWVVAESGLRISRAVITGGVDLEGCVLSKPVLLRHSRLEAGEDSSALNIRDAKLKRFGVHSSTIEGSVMADRAEVDNGMFIGGTKIAGYVQIRGANIGGALAVEGCEIGDETMGLRAAGTRVEGPFILRRSVIAGDVVIPRVHLGAGLYAESCEVRGKAIGIDLESAQVDGDVLFDNAQISGGINLENVGVGGRLSAKALQATAEPEAIRASGLNVSQGLNFEDAKLTGGLILDGAEIGKGFKAQHIEIDGGSTAISADVIHIGGNWDLARSKLVGHVRIPGGDVDGQLRLTEARLFGSDLAFRADGARIRGGCYFSRAMIIGMMRFPACQIGNQFRLNGASLKVERGAALFASGSQFERDVQLGAGLQSAGGLVFDQCQIRGVLDLSGGSLKSATVSRLATMGTAGRSRSREIGETRLDELVISLVDAKVGRLQMPDAAEHRPQGIVDLSRAQVGSFEDFAAAWPPALDRRSVGQDGRDIDHLVLDGFTYEHLGNPSGAPASMHAIVGTGKGVAETRVRWLEGQDSGDIHDHFKPQAWMQLGARLSAQGYHEDARSILIARRRRELLSHSTTAGQRWQGGILDLFALYGYNPWRTIAWMAVFVIAFAAIWGWAGSYCHEGGCRDERVFVVTNRDAYTAARLPESYPGFNALGYSFDIFVPFISFGYADHWRPNANWGPIAEFSLPGGDRAASTLPRSGQVAPRPGLSLTWGGVLYVLGVVEMLLGLVLTSLAVTGFTGLLRRDGT